MRTPDPDDPYLVIYEEDEIPEDERKVGAPSSIPEEEKDGSMESSQESQ